MILILILKVFDMNKEWININEAKPKDREVCLVYRYGWGIKMYTYNEYDTCWDDEEGDDFECDFEDGKYWMSLPQIPNVK